MIQKLQPFLILYKTITNIKFFKFIKQTSLRHRTKPQDKIRVYGCHNEPIYILIYYLTSDAGAILFKLAQNVPKRVRTSKLGKESLPVSGSLPVLLFRLFK